MAMFAVRLNREWVELRESDSAPVPVTGTTYRTVVQKKMVLDKEGWRYVEQVRTVRKRMSTIVHEGGRVVLTVGMDQYRMWSQALTGLSQLTKYRSVVTLPDTLNIELLKRY